MSTRELALPTSLASLVMPLMDNKRGENCLSRCDKGNESSLENEGGV